MGLIDMVGTWMRLAHVPLTSAGDSIDTGTFTAKDNLIIVFSGVGTNASSYPRLRFNGTTGNEYAYRQNMDGGTDNTQTTQNHINTTGNVGAFHHYFVADVTNIDGKEKLVIVHGMDSNTSGAGYAPRRREVAGKWVTTSGQITSVQVLDLGNHNFASGAYITVFGATGDIITDEKDSLTNVPANTRYEETDTRKIYRKVTPTSVTYESDFANNSTGWSTSNARGGFDTTGAWSYNETSTPSDSAKINYDLGSSIDTEFVLRWRMKTASGTKPSNYTYFYLVEQDSLTPTNGTGFVWQGSTNKINIGTQSAEPSSSFTITANTWNYFELVRTSLSTDGIKLYQYTDSNYTSPTLLLTSSGSTTGDERYIQLKSTHNGSVTTKVYVDGIKFYNGATSVSTDEWKERNTA